MGIWSLMVFAELGNAQRIDRATADVREDEDLFGRLRRNATRIVFDRRQPRGSVTWTPYSFARLSCARDDHGIGVGCRWYPRSPQDAAVVLEIECLPRLNRGLSGGHHRASEAGRGIVQLD